MAASIAIIYGFTEGKLHGKRFRRALQKQGYEIETDLASADVIVTHSGGAFTTPPLSAKQLLVHIDPPYWPGRSLRRRTLHMMSQFFTAIRPGNSFWWRCEMSLYNISYLIGHFRSNLQMARTASTFRLEDAVKHGRTILIRTEHDPWLTPELARLRKINPHVIFHSLPGDHIDCWVNPDSYIDIITKELRR
jgi:hypothetical protein